MHGPRKARGRVRCCMDSVPESGTYPECKKCPLGTTSPKGTILENNCVCASSNCASDPDVPAKKSCPGGQFPMGSQRKCEDLTEFGFKQVAGDFVNANGAPYCAGVQTRGGSVLGVASMEDAKKMCSDMGARLCTASEVKLELFSSFEEVPEQKNLDVV